MNDRRERERERACNDAFGGGACFEILITFHALIFSNVGTVGQGFFFFSFFFFLEKSTEPRRRAQKGGFFRRGLLPIV